MSPAGGMECLAGEAVEACDVGEDRPVQLSTGGDQRARLIVAAVRGVDSPEAPGLIELCLADLAIERDARVQLILAGAVANVVVDLRLGGVATGPLRTWFEGVRVKVRGHITGGTGIAVVAPGTANIAGFLQDQEVTDPCLVETDCQADAAETGTHDKNAQRRVLLVIVMHCLQLLHGQERPGPILSLPAVAGWRLNGQHQGDFSQAWRK